MIEKRGHADEQDISTFTDAGFGPDQVLEVIAGLAVSVLANHAGNITNPVLDEPFKALNWKA